MKAILGLLLVFLAGAAHAQVPGYEHHVDTEHLRFAWNEGGISEEGLEMVKARGEEFFAALYEMLGEAPEHRIVVLLEGDAERPDGSWGYPRVDMFGRVHLFRFGPSDHDYMGAFAHELVHAMRIGRMPQHDWFFEEGFAEFLALRVDDDLRGFPWYDFPVDLVAGQWLARGEGIPLTKLREEHRAINIPCKAQSYSLRSAFFDQLGRKYGDEAVLRMGQRDKAGALEDYVEFLGADLETLAAEWEKDLAKIYATIENAEAQAKRYRTESPIQYSPVCDAEGRPQR